MRAAVAPSPSGSGGGSLREGGLEIHFEFSISSRSKGGHLHPPGLDLYPPFSASPCSVVPFCILICTLCFQRAGKLGISILAADLYLGFPS